MARKQEPAVEPAEAELRVSSDVRNGYLTGPGVDRLPVRYNVIDGRAIFDSCIDLGPVEDVEAEADAIRAERAAALSETAQPEPAAAADPGQANIVLMGVGLPTDSSFLWPDGRVPFLVNASLQNPNRVNDAIAHLNANTGIRLVPRTNQTNYVEFIHADNNSSAVGMRGGRQVIRLTPNSPVGTVVHEILHAIGIYHEQSRSDRDTFIEIRWQNIDQNAVGNFQMVPGTVDYFDYDYGSIMHYPRTAFSINNQDTIVPRRPGVTIGQRTALSFTDRQTIAKLYERFFQKGYSGVWRAQSGAYAMWINATWSSFQQKWQEWSGQGLRLVDVHTRQVGNETRYSGVFLPGSGGHGLWANVSWASFTAKWSEWAAQGLRLVSLNVHRVGNEDRYTGAFVAGSGGYGLWGNASWNSFVAKWNEWNGQGLRLIDMHVRRVNGETRYSGVWRAGTDSYGLWANATWSQFSAKWAEWSGQGLRLVDLATHRADGQTRYSGVFRQGTGGHYLWANVTWEGFRAKWEELAAQGLRLVDFDFPSTDIGGPADAGDAESADLADPALELDGFGGIFDVGESTAPVAPGQPGEGEGLGGAVLDEKRPAFARGDGDGSAVFQPDATASFTNGAGKPTYPFEVAGGPAEHGGLGGMGARQ